MQVLVRFGICKRCVYCAGGFMLWAMFSEAKLRWVDWKEFHDLYDISTLGYYVWKISGVGYIPKLSNFSYKSHTRRIYAGIIQQNLQLH